MTLSQPSLTMPAAFSGHRAAATAGSGSSPRVYRLVDQGGNPHPVLDDHYDSVEAAWADALRWWQEQDGSAETMAIGLEVSTVTGGWRTLRHPGS
jgi:hypothetical protein